MKIPAAVDDSYFKGAADDASEERKATQEAVDEELMKCVEKVPMMKEYLNARFYLRKGDHPHDMKF